MNHQKRAEGKTLVTLIIVIVVALVLIPFGGRLYAMIVGSVSDDTCRLSLQAMSKLKKLDPITGTSGISAKCPRKEITFYNDHVEEYIKGRKGNIGVMVGNKKKEKFDGLTDNIFKQVIAEQLRTCWYKTLEGKERPFDQALLKLWGVDSVCMVCATVGFDKELKEEKNTYSNFQNYLDTTTMHGSELRYSDYLTTDLYGQKLSILIFLDKTIPIGERAAVESVDEFSTDNTYSIIYTSFTNAKTNIRSFLKNNFLRLYSIISDKAVGKETFGLLSVIESSDISSVGCNLLYN